MGVRLKISHQLDQRQKKDGGVLLQLTAVHNHNYNKGSQVDDGAPLPAPTADPLRPPPACRPLPRRPLLHSGSRHLKHAEPAAARQQWWGGGWACWRGWSSSLTRRTRSWWGSSWRA